MVIIFSVIATLVLSFVTIAVFIAMGYYAAKNLIGFKGGLLSKGWRYISVAVLFFIAGQLFLDTGAGQAVRGLEVIAKHNIFFGSVMETVAGLLLVAGFRAQNNIWKMERIVGTGATGSTTSAKSEK